MNLTIDMGNSSVKTVVFNNDHIIRTRVYKKISVTDLKNIFSRYAIRNAILSAVVRSEKKMLNFLQSNSEFILLNSKTKLPVKNNYKTPATLGTDRLAAAVGAAKIFPGTNVLVIDAGTCIKYDFITSDKEYLGGSIIPGLRMRFKALHNFTNKLPLIQPSEITHFVETSTKKSILTGVQAGLIHEINGFVQQYRKRFSHMKVI